MEEKVHYQRRGPSLEEEYQQEINDIIKRQEEKDIRRQCLVGVVVSTKNSKTISVEVVREKVFKKYNKVMRVRRKWMAHDELQEAKDGDLVRIVPCGPISTRKSHKLLDILRKAKQWDELKTQPRQTAVNESQVDTTDKQ